MSWDVVGSKSLDGVLYGETGWPVNTYVRRGLGLMAVGPLGDVLGGALCNVLVAWFRTLVDVWEGGGRVRGAEGVWLCLLVIQKKNVELRTDAYTWSDGWDIEIGVNTGIEDVTECVT